MLPALNHLALRDAATGVKINSDGSATVTQEEWAAIARVMGGQLSKAPGRTKNLRPLRVHKDDDSSEDERAPAPAPTPAPSRTTTRRPMRVRNDDDSSEDERAPAPAPAPTPAPVRTTNRLPMRVRNDDDSSEDERAPALAPTPAPPPPPPSQRRRLARTRTVAYDDADTISDLLKEDEIAGILGAIGMNDESKSSACKDAKAWCVLNKEHKAMCDSHPLVWQGLGERIFKQEEVDPADDALFVKGLIYRTFRDDDHAKRAFERMCGANALGDVIAKRFVMSTVGKYGETLWESWNENRADITGLGEDIESLSDDKIEELSVEHYPNIGKTDDWEADAKAFFNSSPSNALYLDKYENDKIFSKLVNVFFESTQKYLLEDDVAIDNINETNRNEPVLEAINEIGELLGVYIVCLWQLELDINVIDTETEHNGRHGGGMLDMEIDEMRAYIQNLRVKVVHAVNTVLDPDTADTITKSNENDAYETELSEYNSVDGDWSFAVDGSDSD